MDREMFLLSMLQTSTPFTQLANLIVHYHPAKIVHGYTQQGKIARLLFGDNVFTSILMLPLQQIMAGNGNIRDLLSIGEALSPSTSSNLVKCNCKKGSCDPWRCLCVRPILHCTGFCQCVACSNMLLTKGQIVVCSVTLRRKEIQE